MDDLSGCGSVGLVTPSGSASQQRLSLGILLTMTPG